MYQLALSINNSSENVNLSLISGFNEWAENNDIQVNKIINALHKPAESSQAKPTNWLGLFVFFKPSHFQAKPAYKPAWLIIWIN